MSDKRQALMDLAKIARMLPADRHEHSGSIEHVVKEEHKIDIESMEPEEREQLRAILLRAVGGQGKAIVVEAEEDEKALGVPRLAEAMSAIHIVIMCNHWIIRMVGGSYPPPKVGRTYREGRLGSKQGPRNAAGRLPRSCRHRRRHRQSSCCPDAKGERSGTLSC